jgi:hypothetical protein
MSKQEQQLIEMLREWTADDEFRLEIERANGAWEISLSIPSKRKAARGVGKTFAEAWDDVAPSWA